MNQTLSKIYVFLSEQLKSLGLIKYVILGLVFFSNGPFQELSAQTYVKTIATGSGTGIDWENALGATSVSNAISSGGIIYIAEGIYNITNTIDLDNNVTVVGGFSNTSKGTELCDYDPQDHLTIFDRGDSGRIFEADGALNITIRGLVLQGANGSLGSIFYGGSSQAVDWRFEDLLIRDNNGDRGFMLSSVTHIDAKITFLNSSFTNNSGTCIYVSNVYNELTTDYQVNNGNFLVEGCSFNDNTTIDGPSSIRISSSHAWTIRNSCFSNNETEEFSGGGALSFIVSYQNVVENCSFSNNKANVGNGGAIRTYSSIVSVHECDFIDNSAQKLGGAIYLHTSSFNFMDCNFYNNDAGDGGAIYSRSSYNSILNVVSNNIFHNNSAVGTGPNAGFYGGGALCIYTTGNYWEISNSIFSMNTVESVDSYGGGIFG